jgi:hypothetical protein
LYLHVGTHKTGTTFLQRDVFPGFAGIEYLPVWTTPDRFLRLSQQGNYLYSNERLAGRLWDSQAEISRSISRLSELFPHANILFSFRRHDGFITSSYKAFLQKGGRLTFDEFFDIDNDQGFMRRDQFLYRKRIESVLENFGQLPFVFLHQEIGDGLPRLLDDLAEYMNAQAPRPEELIVRKRNAGISLYQGKVLRQLNKFTRSRINKTGRFDLYNFNFRRFRLDPRSICQKWLFFLPDGDLISAEQRQKILDFYAKDWEYTESVASSRMRARD